MPATTLARDSIDLLLQEAYDGPADPGATWFTTNAPETGVLGTIRRLSAGQAAERPDGVKHSIAEHVAHLTFSIDLALREANGSTPVQVDWHASWNTADPLDEAQWHLMQRALRESHLRMRMWVHNAEPFSAKESITSFIGSVAHAAYHLGAIRLLASIVQSRAGVSD